MELSDIRDIYWLFLINRNHKQIPLMWQLFPSFDRFEIKNNQWVWKYE